MRYSYLALVRKMSFTQEQNHIIQLQHRMSLIKGRGWNKFRGSVSEQIVAHFLNRHLPNNVKLVRSGFVEGCEHEFDLMIVDKNAKPMSFTATYPGAYPRSHVKLLIEVKASGLYYPNRTLKKILNQLFQKIRNATSKSCLYLSIWESLSKSQMTRNALGNSAFILKEGKNVIPDEWRNFVNSVVSIVKACENGC